MNWYGLLLFTGAACAVGVITGLLQLPLWASFVGGALVGALWPSEWLRRKS